MRSRSEAPNSIAAARAVHPGVGEALLFSARADATSEEDLGSDRSARARKLAAPNTMWVLMSCPTCGLQTSAGQTLGRCVRILETRTVTSLEDLQRSREERPESTSRRFYYASPAKCPYQHKHGRSHHAGAAPFPPSRAPRGGPYATRQMLLSQIPAADSKVSKVSWCKPLTAPGPRNQSRKASRHFATWHLASSFSSSRTSTVKVGCDTSAKKPSAFDLLGARARGAPKAPNKLDVGVDLFDLEKNPQNVPKHFKHMVSARGIFGTRRGCIHLSWRDLKYCANGVTVQSLVGHGPSQRVGCALPLLFI